MYDKKISVLPAELRTFNYYKYRLPLWLQNSNGFMEHFRIWFDMAFGNIEVEGINNSGAISVGDLYLYLLNIFDADFLSTVRDLPNSGSTGATDYGTESDILDKLGELFGVRRKFTYTFTNESGIEETLNLDLNNADFLTYLKAQIIRNYYDGSFEQVREYYESAGLQIYATTPEGYNATSYLILVNDGTVNYSDDVLNMFRAGLLRIDSMGIAYDQAITNNDGLLKWDSIIADERWDVGEWDDSEHDPRNRLSTPTNVAVNGDIVTWNYVPRASKYAVLVDMTPIGYVVADDPPSGVYLVIDNIDNFEPYNSDIPADIMDTMQVWVLDTNNNPVYSTKITAAGGFQSWSEFALDVSSLTVEEEYTVFAFMYNSADAWDLTAPNKISLPTASLMGKHECRRVISDPFIIPYDLAEYGYFDIPLYSQAIMTRAKINASAFLPTAAVLLTARGYCLSVYNLVTGRPIDAALGVSTTSDIIDIMAEVEYDPETDEPPKPSTVDIAVQAYSADGALIGQQNIQVSGDAGTQAEYNVETDGGYTVIVDAAFDGENTWYAGVEGGSTYDDVIAQIKSTVVTRLCYWAFDASGNLIPEDSGEVQLHSMTAIMPKITNPDTAKLAFWADNGTDYDVSDYTKIQLTDTAKVQPVTKDAFWGTITIEDLAPIVAAKGSFTIHRITTDVISTSAVSDFGGFWMHGMFDKMFDTTTGEERLTGGFFDQPYVLTANRNFGYSFINGINMGSIASGRAQLQRKDRNGENTEPAVYMPKSPANYRIVVYGW